MLVSECHSSSSRRAFSRRSRAVIASNTPSPKRSAATTHSADPSTTSASAAPGVGDRPSRFSRKNGIATDIDTGNGAYTWLAANAQRYGFVRTVPTERWHWEYRPGSPRASYT